MTIKKHYIFCISGFSGTGKDEFCKRLVNRHGAVQTGLVDPAKRHMMDLYGFTYDQLFGPSQYRNSGDSRYPKHVMHQLKARECILNELPDSVNKEKNWWCITLSKGYVEIMALEEIFDKLPFMEFQDNGIEKIRYFFEDNNSEFFLSPRETLQQYCELMNNLYGDTWIKLGIDVHRKLAKINSQLGRWVKFKYKYDRSCGLVRNESLTYSKGPIITCFSDFRHIHEFRYTRKARTKFGDFEPIFVRVKRPGIEKPPFDHKSEIEQVSIPDSAFNFIVENKGTIRELYDKVDEIVKKVKSTL
jgi:hypothetical protein